MKIWLIMTPKGNPATPFNTALCAAKTRKECISMWCWNMAYGGITEAEVWADWQEEGYRAVRVEVTPC